MYFKPGGWQRWALLFYQSYLLAKKIKTNHEQTLRDFHSFRNTVNTFLQSKKIIRSHREQLCGWSKMFKDNAMAEKVYLDMLILYSFSERKRDIKLLSELYD